MSKPLVVITGASSGMGEAAAKCFSSAGYPLLMLDIRLEKMEAFNLPNTLSRFVDVSNLAEFKNALDVAEEQFGPADCLINNAGVMLLGLTHEQNPEEWKQMFDVNLLGMMNGIHAVLPGMLTRNHGTIMNTGSVSGLKGFPTSVAYCATKFGVHGLSEALRQEVAAKNVRVINIVPGAVETEILDHGSFKEITDGIKKWKESIGGALKPSVVAEAMLFAYQQPQSVCMREIVLAPTLQEP